MDWLVPASSTLRTNC